MLVIWQACAQLSGCAYAREFTPRLYPWAKRRHAIKPGEAAEGQGKGRGYLFIPIKYTYISNIPGPSKRNIFCSLRYFCSFCQLSGISEIYAETANFMFRTHFVANPANLATRNARKSAENARKSAENARKSAENARKSAESPKPTCFEHGWSNRNVCFLGK